MEMTSLVKKGKGREGWKNSKPRKTFTCNHNAFQNKNDMQSLQNY
jgi:hypothetical protein